MIVLYGGRCGDRIDGEGVTFDLSWLSPLLIFIGVIFSSGTKQTRAGQLGRVGIGLGLILLALDDVRGGVQTITRQMAYRLIFASLTSGHMLDALIGFACLPYRLLASSRAANGNADFQPG